ncbi:MAG TPA: adenylate/guanylate cyclase domain-containing protein, partial [Thermoanaerobaculia bacterium]|nr:adenylate/guanylate cyclase domain-containing protein [Thermoanaerobaculia bacterium]
MSTSRLHDWRAAALARRIMLELSTQIEGQPRSFPLSGERLALGRGNDNDIVLSDYSVSRHHAVFRLEGETWVVEDLGSTNGIEHNGKVIARAALAVGDELKIGSFRLSVEEADETVVLGGAREGKDAAAGQTSLEPPLGTSTIVRSLADFSADYGLGGAAADKAEKRKPIDEEHGTKVFGLLTRLPRLLTQADDVDQILSRVMDIAFEALPVERGLILLKPEGGEEPVCELLRVRAQAATRPQGELPISRTMIETVMRDRVALLTYDAQSDQRLTGGESIRIHQIRAAMCAPLWSGDRIIGVMQVDSPFQVGVFGEQDLDLFTALANFAAVAVERIRYAQSAEYERQIRNRLERYHSPAVIDAVLHRDQESEEEGVRRLRQGEATVMFADLVGFTAFSELASLDDVAELLRIFFTHSAAVIFERGGTLDKFIGDCVMAFFGAPMPQPDHAERAVRAALDIQRAVARWNLERESESLPPLSIRISLNSGPVVVGDIGSDRRVDYTVLGNT